MGTVFNLCSLRVGGWDGEGGPLDVTWLATMKYAPSEFPRGKNQSHNGRIRLLPGFFPFPIVLFSRLLISRVAGSCNFPA